MVNNYANDNKKSQFLKIRSTSFIVILICQLILQHREIYITFLKLCFFLGIHNKRGISVLCYKVQTGRTGIHER